MVLIPDDLVFTPQDVEQLYADLKEYDYATISGICNVDLDANRDKYSITENLPHPVRPLKKIDCKEPHRRWFGWRWYSWFTDKTIAEEQKRQDRIIIRVQHSGFALQAIRRDIVEQTEFRTDGPDNGIEGNSETSSVDVMFSNSLGLQGIAIFVDPRIKMLHLRHSGPVEISLGDGELWHIVNGEKRIYKAPNPVPRYQAALLSQTDV